METPYHEWDSREGLPMPQSARVCIHPVSPLQPLLLMETLFSLRRFPTAFQHITSLGARLLDRASGAQNTKAPPVNTRP